MLDNINTYSTLPKLCEASHNLGAKTGLYVQGGRVRKLTPLECMRLMDFDDADFYKLRDIGMSDAQLYRMCGNSIVVNVVCEIMKNLF